MTENAHVAAGRSALVSADWSAARSAFESALKLGESAEAWDGLGLSLWWLKQLSEGIQARTRAYSMFRRAGRNEEAALVAVWLAREYRTLYRNDVTAEGWIARAEAAAAGVADSRVQGWIHLARAEGGLDAASVIDLVGQAVGLARRQGDTDLEITALARLGVLRIAVGDVDVGIVDIDEAVTAATAGEGRDPQSVGDAFCALMEAADLLGDMERVARWGEALDGYRNTYDYFPLTGFGPSTHATLASFCGACCGGIYVVTGRIDEAEEELLSAIATLRSSGMHSRCVHPVTQLAELRALQGRLEEAQLLLSDYEDLPEAVRPLAVLDLALGFADAAAARLRARIDDLRGVDVITFPLWNVLVDAELTRGDVGGAIRAAKEVERISSLTRSRRHRAESLFAAGKVAAARSEPDASDLLREASKQLSACSLPLLACRARLARARTLSQNDRAVAVSEARAALAAFDRLGATPDADAAAAFLRDLGVKGRTADKNIGLLTKRETDVLRLLSQGLSNAEIAERLFISVKTAGHHVSNILSKLQLRSRTEAAAFAALHLDREPAPK